MSKPPVPAAPVSALTGPPSGSGRGRERVPSTGRTCPELDRKAGVGANRAESGGEPLAIYIHWPFCRSKCPYCDFNSHVRERIDTARWTRALITDLEHQAELAPGRQVGSVFFGGGTPSLMPAEAAAAVLDQVRKRWPTSSEMEITLEANPNSAEAARFEAFAAAGINRLSLGVQALDAAALRFLGRGHDRDEAIAAIALARDIFPGYSFDLIYARPGQSLAAWTDELDEALALAGEHLSLYQLTIEPGTAFATLAGRGALAMPEEERAAELFEMTQQRLAAHALPAYEISNHARPGAECRHNLAYWRYQDYLGIGAGAHGRISIDGVKYATCQRRAPETWLAAVESGAGLEEMVPLAGETVIEEMLMMGLRLVEGVSRSRLEAAAECDVQTLFGPALTRLIEGGFMTLDDDRLAATASGRQRLNAVLAALLA